jgi:DNA mismatch repair protein MutS
MTITPLMKQYFSIKEKYQEAFVFFQVGDFYELFFEDAKKASAILSITLTKRGFHEGNEIPLCGVPVSTIENYTLKLVKNGYIVVICNQTEIAQSGKLVSRDISQVISPGTMIIDQLSEKCCYILFLSIVEKQIKAFFFEFISQKIEYFSFENSITGIDLFFSEFEKYLPKEIIVEEYDEKIFSVIFASKDIKYTSFKENINNIEGEVDFLNRYYLDISYKKNVQLFLYYLNKYHSLLLNSQLTVLSIDKAEFLFLDSSTQRHLELVSNLLDGNSEGTLYSFLNKTSTNMGSRLLHNLILKPLQDINKILERQNIVEELIKNFKIVDCMSDLLKQIGDLERSAYRIKIGRAFYRDYQKILNSIDLINEISSYLYELSLKSEVFKNYYNNINFNDDLVNCLKKYIILDTNLEKLINVESDNELKELNKMVQFQTEIILEFEEKERKRIGIDDILIRQTPLYGYVFEITKSKDKKLPEEFVRVQTLSYKERYTTKDLKDLEIKLINAKEKYKEKENEIYRQVQDIVFNNVKSLCQVAFFLKELDVFLSLAKVSYENNFVRPVFSSDKKVFNVKDAFHPIISNILKGKYVTNNILLNNEEKVWILTGPNMGGKSTFMRQNALIIILAQIGCFVPAKECYMSIFDAIFTRIGATDYVSQGKSTFFVELEEASTICRLATEKSFIILDEIGRGTSTYDGMSIAASILKYLYDEKGSFILFATHYHELYSLLKEEFSWYKVGVAINENDEIVLLYTIKKGRAEESMGIYIAKKIGLDEKIINMAKKYKNELEKSINKNNSFVAAKLFIDEKTNNEIILYKKIVEIIKENNPDETSPKEAHNILINLFQKIN